MRAEPAPYTADPATGWRIEVPYDGDCPLCTREIPFLRARRTSSRGR